MFTKEQVESAMKSKGYKWFSDSREKGFDVNIIGIRNSEPENEVTNIFDDWITISYKEDGEWKFYCWACTTDPGTKAVKEFQQKNNLLVDGVVGKKTIAKLMKVV